MRFQGKIKILGEMISKILKTYVKQQDGLQKKKYLYKLKFYESPRNDSKKENILKAR